MIKSILRKTTILTFLTALAGCGGFQLQSPDGQVFCECVETPPPVEEETQPEDESSSELFAIGDLRVSQETCVSPCTVMLSVEGVVDPSSDNPFTESGVNWDYGDEKADERDGKMQRGGNYFLAQEGTEGFESYKDGTSRVSDTSSPIGMHTYRCEGKDECVYYPGVVVMNKAGDWATKWTKIVVTSQEVAFPGDRTVCVSGAAGWEGCPDGARQASRLPALGAWESDTRYLLKRGESFVGNCMQYDLSSITLSSFGDETLPRAEILGGLEIGRDRSCADPIPPSATGFSNKYWVSDVTVEGIRVDEISLGITYRNITFHDLDMDFENEPRGGTIQGASADACTRRGEFSCDEVPTPYGVYITDTKIIGSRVGIPGVNVSFMSSACVSFFGVENSELQVAFEHNIRLECASRVLVHHNDINGDHIGNRGRKNAVTIRPEGVNKDDMLNQQKRLSTDRLNQYENKYVVIKDNYFGKEGIVDRNAARVSLKPSVRSDIETTSFGLVTQNVFDVPASGVPSNDVHLAGRKLVCRTDNTYQSRNQCTDDGPGVMPPGSYEPADLAQDPPKVPKAPKEYKK